MGFAATLLIRRVAVTSALAVVVAARVVVFAALVRGTASLAVTRVVIAALTSILLLLVLGVLVLNSSGHLIFLLNSFLLQLGLGPAFVPVVKHVLDQILEAGRRAVLGVSVTELHQLTEAVVNFVHRRMDVVSLLLVVSLLTLLIIQYFADLVDEAEGGFNSVVIDGGVVECADAEKLLEDLRDD